MLPPHEETRGTMNSPRKWQDVPVAERFLPSAWKEFCPLIPGRVLFMKIWGSHSHNTNVLGSDVDYLAVYIANNADLLGLNPPLDTLTGEEPDYQAHEVGKFCSLLLKGNPGIVEALFTNRYCDFIEPWSELVDNRRQFLTKRVVEQYLGYINGQLKRMAHGKGLHAKGGTFNTKFAYHIIRLAGDALRIARGDEPVIWKEGLERETLLSIRRGEWSQEKVEDEAREIVCLIEKMKPWLLPAIGNDVFLNKWLLSVRGVRV